MTVVDIKPVYYCTMHPEKECDAMDSIKKVIAEYPNDSTYHVWSIKFVPVVVVA